MEVLLDRCAASTFVRGEEPGGTFGAAGGYRGFCFRGDVVGRHCGGVRHQCEGGRTGREPNGGLGRGLDGFDGHGRRQSGVTDEEARRAVLVDPADFEAPVFALEREESAEVDVVLDADKVADEDAHGELEAVAFGADVVLDAFFEQGLQEGVEVGVSVRCEEAAEEVEEAFGVLVVSRPLDVGAVEKDFVDPVQGLGEFVAAAVRVEQRQNVHADDGVKSGPGVIKVGLCSRFKTTMISNGAPIKQTRAFAYLHDSVGTNVL